MKKILLIPDVEFWAFGNMSEGIRKYAPPEYEVTVQHSQLFQQYKEDVVFLRSWDAIFHWSWVDLPLLFGIQRLVTYVGHDGIKWNYVRDELNQPYMTHWRQWAAATPQRNIGNARKIIPRADGVICVSRDLKDFVYEKVSQKCIYLSQGVDHNLFVPIRRPPLETKMKIGWCGQRGGRTKGFDWVMARLMEKLGDRFEFVINDRNHQDALRPAEMVDWYNSIDVFLCTSISEGGPVPPIEAMSCGRAVLTTAVGDMPDVLATGQGGILMPAYVNDDQAQRTVAHFEERLLALTQDDLRRMGEEARARIEQAFTWEKLAPLWLQFIAG